MPLLNTQKITLNQINQKIIDQPELQKTIFLSGENGIGKTYISAQALAEKNPNKKNPGLVITPTQVFKKWKKVVSIFNPNKHIALFKANHFESGADIYIVKKNDLRNFVISLQEETSLRAFCQIIIDEVHQYNNTQVAYQLSKKLIENQQANNQPTLLMTGTIFNNGFKYIDDIITLAYPDRIANALNDYLKAIINWNYNDSDRNNLNNILITNPNPKQMPHKIQIFSKVAEYQTQLFNALIWTKISVTASMNNIQPEKISNQQLKQTIMPIETIPLSEIEAAYYQTLLSRIKNEKKNYELSQHDENLIMDTLDGKRLSHNLEKKHQLKKSHSHYEFQNDTLTFQKPAKTDTDNKLTSYYHKKVSQFLNENPDVKNQLETVHCRLDYRLFITPPTYYINRLGLPLPNTPIEKSEKFKRLLKILRSNTRKSLIFVRNQELIDEIVTQLNNHGVNAAKLPKNIETTDYGTYIDNALANNISAFIVNPKKINVGVDITHASNIIWYQLLNNAAQVMQAQRRVRRLNSKTESYIYFMAYQNTIQVEKVNTLANAIKAIASTTGHNDRSNLTKKTGHYFHQLD